MKGYTLEKSLMNVKSVASVSENRVYLEIMRRFTLEKSPIVVKRVASILVY